VIRELFSDGWISFLSSLAMKTPAQANTLLIGYTLGPASAATYGLTVRAHDAALLFISQINGALAPSMAHLWGSGNVERFRTLVGRVAMVGALAGGACMAVLISANAVFVGKWLHHEAFAGQSVSAVMAAAVWVSASGSVAYDALYALGRFRTIAMTFVLAAAIHLAVLFLLLRSALWGAPAATLLSTGLWSLIFWWQLQRQIRFPHAQVLRTLLEFLLSGASGAIAGTFLLQLAPLATSWFGLTATAACAALASASVVLLLAPRIRTEILAEITSTVRTLAGRHRTFS
jgi:O-antigen/teichoic acid export membrane protein